MQTNVPTKLDEKFLYIWKIIDSKEVDWKDLMYFIAYELNLAEPKNVKEEIIEAMKQKILVNTSGDNVTLCPELQKKYDDFQKQGELKAKKIHVLMTKPWGESPILKENSAQRASSIASTSISNRITEKKQSSQKKSAAVKANVQQDIPKEISDKSSIEILELLTVKSTVQSGMKLKKEDITFEMLDFEKGIISGHISGTQADPYLFQIDKNMQVLAHNCTDFTMKRVRKKELCKHLVKVFQILIEDHAEKSQELISDFVENRLTWKFNG